MRNPNFPSRLEEYEPVPEPEQAISSHVGETKKPVETRPADEVDVFLKDVLLNVKGEVAREQEKIDGVIADIDAQNVGAPQYGKAWSKDAREGLSAMQTEMKLLSQQPKQMSPEPRMVGEMPEVFEAPQEKESVPVLSEITQSDNIPTLEDKVEVPEGWTIEKLKEATPLEAKSHLQSLINKWNWYRSSEAHLIKRSAELEAEGEKLGMIEGGFRFLGEKYNTLGWKSKLAIGLTLGVGAGVSSAVSLPLALGFVAGGTIQRILGFSTMYLKFEKAAQESDKYGKYGKEMAMIQAIGYTIAMAGAMKVIFEGARETAEAVRDSEWLAHMLGHTNEAVAVPGVPSAPAPEPVATPEAIVTPIATTELPAPAPVVEAPTISDLSVEAVAGRGYEDMLWRLADKLPADFVITPDMEGSDIDKLLTAKEDGTLAKTVHDLATTHGAFLEGGTSKVIQLGDHISFDDKGTIALNDESVSSVLEGRGVTPPWSPVEAPENTLVAEAPVVETTPEVVSVDTDTEQEVVSAETTNAETASFVEQETSMINKYGVEVVKNEPHLYVDQGDKHLMIFGGSFADQVKMMREYFTKNPDSIIFGTNAEGERVPFTRSDGSLLPIGDPLPGAPVEKSRFFGIFGHSVMKAPEPDDFRKIVQ